MLQGGDSGSVAAMLTWYLLQASAPLLLVAWLAIATSRMPAGVNNFALFRQERTHSKTVLLGFVVFAFGWSWAIGFFGTQLKSEFPILGMVLLMAAGFGPSLAGVVVVSIFIRGTELREWLGRCFNWRLGWRWYALAFASPPAVMLSALAIHGLLGGSMPALLKVEQIPLAIANFALVLLVGGPLGEEFGWRGYALPALAARLNWRVASLIVGVLWGAWHLPLFFMAGSIQSQLSIPVFLLNILAGSVVFGWLFERTKGSLLPALVLHTSLNAWSGILGIIPSATSSRPYFLVTGLLVLIAIALLLSPSGKSKQSASLAS